MSFTFSGEILGQISERSHDGELFLTFAALAMTLSSVIISFREIFKAENEVIVMEKILTLNSKKQKRLSKKQ